MKSEIQIREQIEKLKKAISKDEEFLRNATGNDVTLENRIAIQNEINNANTLLCTVTSFLDWKEQQHKIIRGGKVMYDVKGHYKYLYEHELFEYWSVHNCA